MRIPQSRKLMEPAKGVKDGPGPSLTVGAQAISAAPEKSSWPMELVKHAHHGLRRQTMEGLASGLTVMLGRGRWMMGRASHAQLISGLRLTGRDAKRLPATIDPNSWRMAHVGHAPVTRKQPTSIYAALSLVGTDKNRVCWQHVNLVEITKGRKTGAEHVDLIAALRPKS